MVTVVALTGDRVAVDLGPPRALTIAGDRSDVRTILARAVAEIDGLPVDGDAR